MALFVVSQQTIDSIILQKNNTQTVPPEELQYSKQRQLQTQLQLQPQLQQQQQP